MTAKLELQELQKRFEDIEAVRGLSLSLDEGEFLSLLGPSGCGKSTMLAMIAGFLAPDGGDILVDGRSIVGIPPQRRRIGLVFQDYAIFSRLSVRSNLAFGLEAQRVPRRERKRRVEAFAEQLHLTDLLNRTGAQLNMSEMQAVALARVLITEPQLLLLDEPMSNLDAADRADLRGELKQLQKRLGQAVLYVTHDQVEAMSMSDRIAVMRDGVIMQVGSPEEIYRHPVNRFVAEFIGDPPINLLPCQVMTSGHEVRVSTACHGEIRLGKAEIEAGEHWLAVRPHVFKVWHEPTGTSAPVVVRFVENFGSEHVLHVEYGDQLARVVAPPGFAGVMETVHLDLDASAIHLIDRGSETTVRRDAVGVAA
jgi:ABC-type sugar transport system ATPase subunit